MTSSRTVVAVAGAAVAVLLAGCGSSGTPAATSTGTSASSAAAGSSGVTSSAAFRVGGVRGRRRGRRGRRPSGSSASGSSGAAPADAAMEQYCPQSGGQVQGRSPSGTPTATSRSGWPWPVGRPCPAPGRRRGQVPDLRRPDHAVVDRTHPRGLAYLSKVPMPSGDGGGNPATSVLQHRAQRLVVLRRGGASGGGWVNKTDPDDSWFRSASFPTDRSSTSGVWPTTPRVTSAART